jgi:osmoprotectant transport system permease protein
MTEMSGFLDFISQHWRELLVLTREHILIVLLATGFAVAAGLPLGVLLTRYKKLQTPVLGFANVMQTVPSLALFGLLIPLPFIGGIGARTAVIALALYALLPIIRNTVTGISGVDGKLIEAASAMGMTGAQRLRMVELPLAMPVILAGVRVAVVISVGVATIAALIGGGGLGTYIFRGLRQNDNNMLLAGASASALLALLFDVALGRIEKAFRIGRGPLKAGRVVGVAAVAAVFVGVLIFGSSFGPSSAGTSNVASGRVVVASKDFTESVILAEILSQMLEKNGVTVERKYELAGNLAHDALLSGQIDVYPEYTGTAYTAILKHAAIADAEQVYETTKAEYAKNFGLSVSQPLGFSNGFAILVRSKTAREQNLRTISDAAAVSADWQAGFGQDFMSRADGYPGMAAAYGFKFNKLPREMDLSLTYRALASGELDIIAGNETDGLIDALELIQLSDDKHYFPPYQAVYVARKDAEPLLREIFEQLNNSITTEQMRKMNYEVDGKKRSPKDVAADWLKNL